MVLTCNDTSSLVVDRLCDMARERNMAVSCFYVDFAAREEQSPANILGSLLKQIVGKLGKIPDEISQMFQDNKEVIGGRGLRGPEIVKLLQTVTNLQPAFICIDALDECVEKYRPEILDSLRQILENSPNARIFLTGRRHVRGEIDRHLGGRATVLSIKPSRKLPSTICLGEGFQVYLVGLGCFHYLVCFGSIVLCWVDRVLLL